MTKLLKIYLTVLTIALLGIGGYALIDKPYQNIIPAVGGTVLPATTGTFYLAGSGVSSNATSITLTKFQISQNSHNIQDGELGDTMFFTLEPGSTSRQETISCETIGTNTGGNVTISDCTRGLSAISPYTASSTLQFSHSGGSKVILSNPAAYYNQITFKGNDETITGLWTFTDGSLPVISSYTAPTSDTEFAVKKYVDDVAIAGGADGGFTTKGIYEQATQIEMASSTGSVGNQKALTSLYSTSTPTVRGLYIPVSENDGYLSQLWLDLTENFAFSGNNTHSGTNDFTGLFSSSATSTMATTTITSLTADADSVSPIILNGIDYTFPSTEGASSTVLSTDGSGGLMWKEDSVEIETCSGTLTIPSGNSNGTVYGSCDFQASKIEMYVGGNAGDGIEYGTWIWTPSFQMIYTSTVVQTEDYNWDGDTDDVTTLNLVTATSTGIQMDYLHSATYGGEGLEVYYIGTK